jgi:hypothetical protein
MVPTEQLSLLAAKFLQLLQTKSFDLTIITEKAKEVIKYPTKTNSLITDSNQVSKKNSFVKETLKESFVKVPVTS